MAAQTGDRDNRWSNLYKEITPSPKQKGNTIIFMGAGTVYDVGGFLIPAADVAGAFTAGFARERSVSTGMADGDKRCRIGVGDGRYKTGGAQAITQAEIGEQAFWLDDQTVVKAAGTVNSIKAGKIMGIDPDDGQIIVDHAQIV